MKPINLLSLVDSYHSLNTDTYNKFLKFYNIEIRNKEVDDIQDLINNIIKVKKSIELLNEYYVGYKIPQIGKEFDLLRFGKDYIINIEVKNQANLDKVLKQLKKNKYYLSFLNKNIYTFSYIANEKKLYYLNENDELKVTNFQHLVKKLETQTIEKIHNLDNLFDPTNYLVSPFNTTEKFIENKYFLTQQQESFKKEILNNITNNQTNFIAITGSAGTGKTLLTYDIAKTVMNNGKKTLIIHCGILNTGQEKLKEKHNWNIISIKDYQSQKLTDYDLIILDEVQRIKLNQFKNIVKTIQENNMKCIFSYDKLQTLTIEEENNNIDSKINSLEHFKKYKLSEKIRTNTEIANFIKMFFNSKRNDLKVNGHNIYITYFNNINESKEFQQYLNTEGWIVIRFTPDLFKLRSYENFFINSISSHEVIGQEYDNVTVVIDRLFLYDKNGNLQYSGNVYYHPVKMLFQNLTRVRKKLHIIIVNNEEILNRCLNILNT